MVLVILLFRHLQLDLAIALNHGRKTALFFLTVRGEPRVAFFNLTGGVKTTLIGRLSILTSLISSFPFS